MCLGTPAGVVWCLLVSVVVLNCPEIPGGGHCEHMAEVYVCLWGLDAYKGVLECSGLLGSVRRDLRSTVSLDHAVVLKV